MEIEIGKNIPAPAKRFEYVLEFNHGMPSKRVPIKGLPAALQGISRMLSLNCKRYDSYPDSAIQKIVCRVGHYHSQYGNDNYESNEARGPWCRFDVHDGNGAGR